MSIWVIFQIREESQLLLVSEDSGTALFRSSLRWSWQAKQLPVLPPFPYRALANVEFFGYGCHVMFEHEEMVVDFCHHGVRQGGRHREGSGAHLSQYLRSARVVTRP